MNIKSYFLMPGYIFISGERYKITTVLGSCVSAFLIDKINQVGGANHIILSKIGKKDNGRYGEYAMPKIIELFKKRGCSISNLEAYVVGGSYNKELSSIIGINNSSFVIDYLEKLNIKIHLVDTGGYLGRKVVFDNYNGNINIIKIGIREIKDYLKV